MATQRNPNSILIWRKSHVSGGTGECIEVAGSGFSVLVRDSRDKSGATLEFSVAQWRGFVNRLKSRDAPSG